MSWETEYELALFGLALLALIAFGVIFSVCS